MKFCMLAIAAICVPVSAVTLVSRSAGLELPDKESGNTELEIGDVNDDGYLDIVSVGDHGSPNVGTGEHGIMVWLGDGQGNWSVVQTGDFGYGGCALGDLNGDGHMDVAWGVHHNYAPSPFGDRLMGAALGDGTGYGWTPWDTGLATGGEDWGMFATDLADFDLDGDLDIVCESFGADNGIRMYENYGDGTWAQAWLIDGWNSNATLETGDFNADGCMDFIGTRWGTQVYFGDGALGFTLIQAGIPEANYISVDCGDFNHDGADDIVCSLNTDSGARCYSYDSASGEWVDHSIGLPTGVYIDLVQFGDVDGDGNLDLVLYAEPVGTVYLGNGAGGWTQDASWTMPSPGEATALRIDGDVDHDGREDIAIEAEMTSGWWDRNQLRLYSPWSEPSALEVRILRPDGGEAMYAGSVREIRWVTAVPPVQGQALVDMYLSTAGGSGPWSPIASGVTDNGSFQWTVPLVSSADCAVKVVTRTDADTSEAVSQDSFSIMYQTGIEESGSLPVPALGLMLHPNPSPEVPMLTVHGTPGSTILVMVCDVSGRLARSEEISGGGPVVIALEAVGGGKLPVGVYFVSAVSGSDRAATRFVQL